jgi:excinuclease ABC subunit B
MDFKLISEFKPTGDQPEAIEQLVQGINEGEKHQVLLGVTGSGKTFTMANVIQQVQKPTLILSHNKTLVAQLYGEFKQFFPDNAVEYFVSYYDYYQPEAYISVSDTFIEKDLSINSEIEKLRLRTTSSLMSGRRDVIVVSSVSCLYGMGNPTDYTDKILRITVGDKIERNTFLLALVDILYSRTTADFNRGNFRVTGDTVDVFLAYTDFAYRITFFGDDIEEINAIDPVSGRTIERLNFATIFPANLYVTPKDRLLDSIFQIQDDMMKQVNYFKANGQFIEAKRIEDRVTFDLEMMRELGYCSGIENYSRYLDQRQPGERPFCLLDYFPPDFLIIIDESHVTIPQLRAMYGGDRSRKQSLVQWGFRLASAMDNRPLKFEEFEQITNQIVYVSATPADYELQMAEGVVIEQVIRPTGLLDPPIEVRPVGSQVDDLLHEISLTIAKNERILVTTLTKRMAEELTAYMADLNIKCNYIHSEVDTLARVEILRDLRLGKFDVLVGVNLLREGLDLPEVSLVAILDADKEGFLRSERSLTQTSGRAARNVNGRVIMYADKITESMRKTIDETTRRREKQLLHNQLNGITPLGINKSIEDIIGQTSVLDIKAYSSNYDQSSIYIEPENTSLVADPVLQYMNADQLKESLKSTKKQMEAAAKALDFVQAAKFRDEMFALEKLLQEKSNQH